MSACEVISQIKLDRKSGEALHLQLERELTVLISRLPDGTILPPERQVAADLGVSRITVRHALQPFLDRGEIVRRPRIGTIVAAHERHSLAEGSLPGCTRNDPHCFSFPWLSAPVANLQMVLYETLPQQKVFWQKAVEKFSEIHRDCSIRLVWQTAPGCEKYLSLCASGSNTDIFLYSPTMEKYLPELALELPEKLQRKLTGFPGNMSRELAALSRWLVPVHLAVAYTFWNPELAEKCGLKDVRQQLLSGNFFNLAAQAAETVPENCMVAGHVWDYLACYGHLPEQPVDSSLEEVIDWLTMFQEKKRSFHCSQRYSRDIIDNFICGKQLFLTTYSSQLQWDKSELGKMEKVPALFTCNNIIPCCFVAAAVSAETRFKDEALAFMEFLGGEYIQQYCQDFKGDMPFGGNALEQALQRGGFSAVMSQNFVRRLTLMGKMNGCEELYSQFATFRTREILSELFAGKLTSQQATAQIREKWKLFYRQFFTGN